MKNTPKSPMRRLNIVLHFNQFHNTKKNISHQSHIKRINMATYSAFFIKNISTEILLKVEICIRM